MEIRVLGAHMLESRDTRHTCFLIDNIMALDAGSLAASSALWDSVDEAYRSRSCRYARLLYQSGGRPRSHRG